LLKALNYLLTFEVGVTSRHDQQRGIVTARQRLSSPEANHLSTGDVRDHADMLEEIAWRTTNVRPPLSHHGRLPHRRGWTIRVELVCSVQYHQIHQCTDFMWYFFHYAEKRA